MSIAETVTMNQPIAGVSPAAVKETTIMTVWPSVAQYGLGRALGNLYAIRAPDIYFVRLGNLFALLAIPVALVLYFMRVAPVVGRRYMVTNRRVVVLRGMRGEEEKSVELDRFNAIDIVVRPGMEWYHAGDLIFRQGNTETFRLEGVSRPESFQAVCLKAHMAYTGVKQAMARQRG